MSFMVFVKDILKIQYGANFTSLIAFFYNCCPIMVENKCIMQKKFPTERFSLDLYNSHHSGSVFTQSAQQQNEDWEALGPLSPSLDDQAGHGLLQQNNSDSYQ